MLRFWGLGFVIYSSTSPKPQNLSTSPPSNPPQAGGTARSGQIRAVEGGTGRQTEGGDHGDQPLVVDAPPARRLARSQPQGYRLVAQSGSDVTQRAYPQSPASGENHTHKARPRRLGLTPSARPARSSAFLQSPSYVILRA
jgi:hypothetical protein